jgi:hypothetical protein
LREDDATFDELAAQRLLDAAHLVIGHPREDARDTEGLDVGRAILTLTLDKDVPSLIVESLEVLLKVLRCVPHRAFQASGLCVR